MLIFFSKNIPPYQGEGGIFSEQQALKYLFYLQLNILILVYYFQIMININLIMIYAVNSFKVVNKIKYNKET